MTSSSNYAHGNVLIVMDRSSVWRGVEKTLRDCGFNIVKTSTPEEAFMRLRRNDYDAVLVDLDFPGMGGFKACTQIRSEFPGMWIIAVATEDCQEDRVDALNAGADHCITIPLHLREFAARIRAIVRRLRPTLGKTKSPLVVGDFHLDIAKHVVKRDGREIRLTTTEFNLLYQLMARAGQPIPHSTLLDVVWGNHTAKERAYLRIYISSLRKKLEVEPAQPCYLLTHANIGYIFATPNGSGGSIH